MIDTLASKSADNSDILLRVDSLKTWFPVRKGVFSRVSNWVRAVDGVSFDIPRGKTLALVGESGSGKTTVGRSVLALTKSREGSVNFDGHDIINTPESRLRPLRKRMQIVFQDPFGSLNPRMTVGEIITEPMKVHKMASGSERKRIAGELLKRVGLSADYVNRYPHEFSGGQRQRIGIARAISVRPDFIVCDEPVSALDVSIQAQILNLLKDIQQEFGISYLFIAHNLAVVEHFADEVAVMYLGGIVEKASRDQIYENPQHPYTQALMSAAPKSHPAETKTRIVLAGEVPSPINPPAGCRFHTRCGLTAKLAADAPVSEVTTINTPSGQRKIMSACQQPQILAEITDRPGHCCACCFAAHH